MPLGRLDLFFEVYCCSYSFFLRTEAVSKSKAYFLGTDLRGLRRLGLYSALACSSFSAQHSFWPIFNTRSQKLQLLASHPSSYLKIQINSSHHQSCQALELHPSHLYSFQYYCTEPMQSLRRQNAQLQKNIQSFLEEIDRQKQLNSQHESEIQTLLKFNQRLLGIIENQLNNKKDTCSLQPISERSERESDLIGPAMNSLMKSKRLAAKSERGPATRNSLVERAHHKLNLFQKQPQKSEINHSFDNEQLSDFKLQHSQASKPQAQTKLTQATNAVKNEMNKQISQLKRFTKESNKFYDNKINQIRTLSSKLGTYRPIQQFSKISQKLNLSAGAADMIRKAIMKSSQ